MKIILKTQDISKNHCNPGVIFATVPFRIFDKIW